MDFSGDMDKIMESVLCVETTDEPRIKKIIQDAIDSGELPSYNAFVKETKQKMNARKRKVCFSGDNSFAKMSLNTKLNNCTSVSTLFICNNKLLELYEKR